MGEVYKARDPRLNRTVAIKVLPQPVADMAERKERFEREAQTIAALNHPHICVVYDVGHDSGVDYIVMEYLEGETLADRIAKGPIPFDQLLTYATQTADALDKAHRQGVIHRDLKPGNIMITKSGAKLLDFGLAKLQQPAAAPHTFSALATAVSDGPPLTADGMILARSPVLYRPMADGSRMTRTKRAKRKYTCKLFLQAHGNGRFQQMAPAAQSSGGPIQRDCFTPVALEESWLLMSP
jgi:serine/threonine protein kinase